MKRLVLAAAAALGFSGCIFASYNVPLSFRSETRFDVGNVPAAGDAHGEACASQLLGLIAFGDGGYDAAYKSALVASGATELFDVRSDTHLLNVLGIFSQACTVVTGKIARK